MFYLTGAMQAVNGVHLPDSMAPPVPGTRTETMGSASGLPSRAGTLQNTMQRKNRIITANNQMTFAPPSQKTIYEGSYSPDKR